MIDTRHRIYTHFAEEPLRREVRDIPGEVVRRVWNESLRNYEIIRHRSYLV